MFYKEEDKLMYEKLVTQENQPNLDIIIKRYTQRAMLYFEQYTNHSNDSEIVDSTWTPQQAEAQKMCDIYIEVIQDLRSLKRYI